MINLYSQRDFLLRKTCNPFLLTFRRCLLIGFRVDDSKAIESRRTLVFLKRVSGHKLHGGAIIVNLMTVQSQPTDTERIVNFVLFASSHT